MSDPEMELGRVLREGSSFELRALFMRLEDALEAGDLQRADGAVVEIAAELDLSRRGFS